MISMRFSAYRFWFLLALGLALPAAAQFLPPEHAAAMPPGGPPQGGPPGPSSPAADPMRLLLDSVQVQTALGLSEEKQQALERIRQDFQAGQRAAANSGPAAQRDLERQIRNQGGAIDQILSPEQLQRLRQLMLRLEGPCLAIRDRDFIQKMELNREQQLGIATLCRQIDREIHRGVHPAAPGIETDCATARAMQTRVERVRLQGQVRIEGLLSESQRDTLNQLQGPEIVIEPLLPPSCRRAADGG